MARLSCLEVDGNPLEGRFAQLLAPSGGVATMNLYRGLFFSGASVFPDELKPIEEPEGAANRLDTMPGPTMVGNTPFEITMELTLPDSSYDQDYLNIGGYAIYMVADDGSRSHKPFKGVDLQGVGGVVHVATVRPSDEFTFRSPCQASHPQSRQHTVKNLQPGERYAFAVKALCADPQLYHTQPHRLSSGAARMDSEMSDFVEMSTLPAQVPDAPGAPVQTRVSWDSVELQWDVPEDHCFPISEYVVYATRAGNTLSSSDVVGRTTLTQHKISGLEADTSYHFAVAARNVAGVSSVSSSTFVTQPALPSVRPASPAVDQISFFYVGLSWTYPAMRGADITGMEVQQMAEDGTWISIGTHPPARTEMMQGDLEPGRQYKFRLRTHSLAGPSDCSDVLIAATRTAAMPGAAYPPSVINITTTCATVQWGPELMSDYDGPPVTHWELQQQDKTRQTWEMISAETFSSARLYSRTGSTDHHFHRPSAVAASQCCLDSLAAGSEYSLRVRAVNDEGPGDWSEPTRFTTLAQPPAQPEMLKVEGEPTHSSISLTMTAPDECGASVLGYCVQQRSSRPWYTAENETVKDVSAWYSVGEFPPNVLLFTISEGLEAGMTHSFRYCARSNAGDSEWSETLDIALPPALPANAPVITRCEVHDFRNAVEITWTIPETNGAMVNGYEIWSLATATSSWQLIYTGYHNYYLDDDGIDVEIPPLYRVRAITDETPPSAFSKSFQATPRDTYGEMIPIVIKGHWGPQQFTTLWVSRNETITNLRYKVPHDLYPSGKVAAWDQTASVRFTRNGETISEGAMPKDYSLVVSDETGGGSRISGNDIVIARDLSFARIYNRLLRHTNKLVRQEQTAVDVIEDRTGAGAGAVYFNTSGYPTTGGPFLKLGTSRIQFRKCARVPADDLAYALPGKGPTFPLFKIHGADSEEDSVLRSTLPDGLANGHALIPMYQKEAMWMDFQSCEPTALKICYGGQKGQAESEYSEQGINVLTGKTDVPLLMQIKKSHVWPPNAQQNYMVVPEQQWLGNMNVDEGQMAQFTSHELDNSAAAEAQMSGAAPNSLKISAFPLLKSDATVRFTSTVKDQTYDLFATPEVAGLRDGDVVHLRSTRLPGVHSATLADHGIGPHTVLQLEFVPSSLAEAPSGAAAAVPQVMSGFSGGGRITDKVYPDFTYGPDQWDVDVEATAVVHMVNHRVFLSSTGLPMPETGIRQPDYNRIGHPSVYEQSWDDEPDTIGIFSAEVSEVNSSHRTTFLSHSALIAQELRK